MKCATEICDATATSGPHISTGLRYCKPCRVQINCECNAIMVPPHDRTCRYLTGNLACSCGVTTDPCPSPLCRLEGRGDHSKGEGACGSSAQPWRRVDASPSTFLWRRGDESLTSSRYGAVEVTHWRGNMLAERTTLAPGTGLSDRGHIGVIAQWLGEPLPETCGEPCRECDGTGREPLCDDCDAFILIHREYGSGIDHDEPCAWCSGRGTKKVTSQVKVCDECKAHVPVVTLAHVGERCGECAWRLLTLGQGREEVLQADLAAEREKSAKLRKALDECRAAVVVHWKRDVLVGCSDGE